MRMHGLLLAGLVVLAALPVRAQSQREPNAGASGRGSIHMVNGHWVHGAAKDGDNDYAPSSGGRSSVSTVKFVPPSDQPFAIYFSALPPSSEKDKTGAPRTIWENPGLGRELEGAGINTYVKLYVEMNPQLVEKYGAVPNSLVICSTNGDKLAMFAGAQCTLFAIADWLKNFRAEYDTYKDKKIGDQLAANRLPE